MTITKKLQHYWRNFFLDKHEKAFISHNKEYFRGNSQKKESIILMELNESCSNLISYSYVASILAKKYDSSIYSFYPRIPRKFHNKMLWMIRSKFGFKTTTLFNSFGSEGLIVPSLNSFMKDEAKNLYTKKINSIKAKDDLERLEFFGILFGDLIYDYYLAFYKETEIDLSSEKFKLHLKYCIELIVFWKSFLEIGKVTAINVSHTVYTNAIPLRIGIKFGIPSFQTTAKDIYQLNKERQFAYTEFKDYKTLFTSLDSSVKKKGLIKAKERIDSRFSGKVGVDMSYSKKSAFGNPLNYRLIKESPNIKILVAPHCFFDSPHPYGHNLFPDVLEWLKELVRVSKETNYDWYVKTHPDFIQETKDVVELFFKDEPSFKILPSNSSHNQIIDEGIDFALTMYGTIAFEYAAKKIPVINASINNPHIAYDFNINPKSRLEYKNILMDLQNISHTINVNDVYEYYYMKNLYSSRSWLFEDYDESLDYVGGYSGQFKPLIFKYWLEKWNITHHNKTLRNVEIFLDSKEYRFETNNLNYTT
jgi:hypothetical protein